MGLSHSQLLLILRGTKEDSSRQPSHSQIQPLGQLAQPHPAEKSHPTARRTYSQTIVGRRNQDWSSRAQQSIRKTPTLHKIKKLTRTHQSLGLESSFFPSCCRRRDGRLRPIRKTGQLAMASGLNSAIYCRSCLKQFPSASRWHLKLLQIPLGQARSHLWIWKKQGSHAGS